MSLLERYTQPGESQLPTVAHVGEIPSGQPTCSIWIDGKEVTAIHVEAARLVKEVLPFPYMLGLVCPKPCQEVCRRGLVEEEIAICQCHGYTGEMVMEMDKAPTPFPQLPATGKRVAVVGAGPAGMTAAYYAARKGHAVTVFDMMEKQGGI